MINTKQKHKIEYGDFQTPIELANQICHKLLELDVNPNIIIEPTCGVGNFINASLKTFINAQKIIGIDINSNYLQQIKNNRQIQSSKITLQHSDFFTFDWSSLTNQFNNNILVIGNFPWVTNSQQGKINSINLPQKNNFQNHNGLDAITGKSNFDISEWMLIKTVDWLHNYNSYLAMLCKISVARKILNYIYFQKLNLAYFSTYKIDSKKYFQANVASCLLFCKFNSSSQQYFCDVFQNLDDPQYQRIGYYNKTLVRDLESFEKVSLLFSDKSYIQWRSGIKHDCSKVMELSKINNILVNGFGETVDIEDRLLFPLLKGSDIANGKIIHTKKYVLVTQKNIGDSTEFIKSFAPKTWKYLEKYSQYLDARKSKIYQNKPRFSVFGVGEYTFKPWKIAICGLYKKLDFQFIGQIDDKPTIFDDTVYFLSFDDEEYARKTYRLITTKTAIEFYSSLIFWDEKRPIKTKILNSLNLTALQKIATLI
ncbi:MAG: SAM-dependent methyltransferase [Pleurocapsa sp.]